MHVDTGEFRALTDEIAVLRDQVAELAGYHRKVAVNVAALMVRTGLIWEQPAAPASRPRPGHLSTARDETR